ncbi:hypothetical protein [Hymenobacter sp. CRA2]|uniref:hypothetical protein n=1 Tax=Hymenobacter sp. CRA2 TaxID=1955620 RepID=UPI00098F83A2|nr:hypothetical protein [Hymenobacter sp. CRA2]OON70800.1 hypothetical protein B0919_01960 [Hymenobacter sp. CRA2]
MKSIASFLLIAAVVLGALFQHHRWDGHDVVIWDVAGYYQYLTSHFIYDDVGDGSYTAAVRRQYRPEMDGRYGLVPAPNGQQVMKYPMGMAVFYAPGFFAADAFTKAKGEYQPDGYTAGYQRALALIGVAYALLGLWVLRRVLLRFFDDSTTALALLAIGLATNYFCYTAYEPAMSHGTLFLLNALLIWTTVRWFDTFRWGYAVVLGLVMGLMVLVRPTEAWMALVPALWGLTSAEAVRQRVAALWQHRAQLLVAVVVAAAIVSVQPLFWHQVGGAWFIDSYPGEKFDFRHPHILDGLFSPRKGWLVYTPIMALALIGILLLRRQARAALPVLLPLLPLVLYVTYSWWDWGYGGSFSARPLISLYPLLAFPLAALIDRCRRSPWLLHGFALVLVLCVVLNLYQTWQYYRGILHCCDTTWAMYKEHFFWFEWPQPGS